jgi:hypothetical protein
MIVFVCGMPRSGSTFSFNVVRETLELMGKVHQEASPGLASVVRNAEQAGADHVILKAHSADDGLTRAIAEREVLAVCTVRPVEQAAASWIDTFNFDVDQTIEAMRTWLEMYSRIRDYSLVVPYEEIARRPISAVWRITRYIDPTFSPLRAGAIAYRYRRGNVKALANDIRRGDPNVQDIGFSYYDSTTFFHRRHVSDTKNRRIEQYMEATDIDKLRSAIEPVLTSLSDRRIRMR